MFLLLFFCNLLAYDDCRVGFVTSDIFPSSLVLHGGVAVADGVCTDAARSSGNLRIKNSPHRWIAWLSSKHITAPMRLLNEGADSCLDLAAGGTLVASNMSDLLDGSVSTSSWQTEHNTSPLRSYFWSGTKGNGLSALANCADWTSNLSALRGRVGRINATDAMWTSAASFNCTATVSLQLPLLCIEGKTLNASTAPTAAPLEAFGDCRTMFFTNDTFKAGELDGAAGADRQCAAAMALSNNARIRNSSQGFVAWLDTRALTGALRVSHGGPESCFDRAHDGALVASSLSELELMPSLQSAVWRTEVGVVTPRSTYFRGSSNASGSDESDTCWDLSYPFNDKINVGAVGAADYEWNLAGQILCAASNSDRRPLLCIEKASMNHVQDPVTPEMYENCRTTFVTATIFDGQLGGAAGADAKCTDEKATATNERIKRSNHTFVAWLSDGSSLPWDRLEGGDSCFDRAIDGTGVAGNLYDFKSLSLTVPIWHTQKDETAPRSSVWTGLNQDGTAASWNCKNFTDSDGGFGRVGFVAADGTVWFGADVDYSCYSGTGGRHKRPLLCVEKASRDYDPSSASATTPPTPAPSPPLVEMSDAPTSSPSSPPSPTQDTPPSPPSPLPSPPSSPSPPPSSPSTPPPPSTSTSTPPEPDDANDDASAPANLLPYFLAVVILLLIGVCLFIIALVFCRARNRRRRDQARRKGGRATPRSAQRSARSSVAIDHATAAAAVANPLHQSPRPMHAMPARTRSRWKLTASSRCTSSRGDREQALPRDYGQLPLRADTEMQRAPADYDRVLSPPAALVAQYDRVRQPPLSNPYDEPSRPLANTYEDTGAALLE